jgi:hypothetical protein
MSSHEQRGKLGISCRLAFPSPSLVLPNRGIVLLQCRNADALLSHPLLIHPYCLTNIPSSPRSWRGCHLDTATCGVAMCPSCAVSPVAADAVAGEEADDHIEEGDDAVDDGHADAADAVDNGHENRANSLEAGADLRREC